MQDRSAPAPERPLKLLHLSDFHASWAVSLGFIEEAVDLGLQLKPDLICLTGDFITRQYAEFDCLRPGAGEIVGGGPGFCLPGQPRRRALVRQSTWRLQSTQPVRQLLQQSRIELLHNRSATLRLNGRDVRLTGVADVWSENVNLAAAFPPPAAGGAATRTFCFPTIRTPRNFCGFIPGTCCCAATPTAGRPSCRCWARPGRRCATNGSWRECIRWENRWIHITRGVGNVHGCRFNCPPEVSLITLV
jgi:predicted MPP superfamily phosphohydrolase